MKKPKQIIIVAVFWLVFAAACGNPDSGTEPAGKKVQTTGKETIDHEQVPAEVLAAARLARPDLDIVEAEYEVRDGREYYDVGGRLPDGSEMELDMTRIDGVWTVVEFQRDIGIDIVPSEVRVALDGVRPDWVPQRIIESEQADGIVIYEFFGPDTNDQQIKVEVKWDDPAATVLTEEWAH